VDRRATSREHEGKNFTRASRPAFREDKEAETQKAIVQDAAEYDGKDRDLIHGDGGTLSMPIKTGEGDISKHV
jgi:hypothetical protein